MNRFSETLQRFAKGQVGLPGVELVYTSHARWPLQPNARGVSSETEPSPKTLAVSVLDSSFNPPTLAHLALYRTPPPKEAGPTSRPGEFDAKLLLFSIKNADKALKPGDATHSQRLEMMVLLANELEQIRADQGSKNVAVAVCQEPTFVGKSSALRLFLRERLATIIPKPDSDHTIQLFFLLGLDTLERLFATRYYDSEIGMKDALRTFLSPSGDNSRVICARRSSGSSYSRTDSGVPDAAAEFIKSGAVVLVDIGEIEQSLSSSEVRENVRGLKSGWEHKVPRSVAEYIKENHLYKVADV